LIGAAGRIFLLEEIPFLPVYASVSFSRTLRPGPVDSHRAVLGFQWLFASSPDLRRHSLSAVSFFVFQEHRAAGWLSAFRPRFACFSKKRRRSRAALRRRLEIRLPSALGFVFLGSRLLFSFSFAARRHQPRVSHERRLFRSSDSRRVALGFASTVGADISRFFIPNRTAVTKVARLIPRRVVFSSRSGLLTQPRRRRPGCRFAERARLCPLEAPPSAVSSPGAACATSFPTLGFGAAAILVRSQFSPLGYWPPRDCLTHS
jgi:hypothetical protein